MAQARAEGASCTEACGGAIMRVMEDAPDCVDCIDPTPAIELHDIGDPELGLQAYCAKCAPMWRAYAQGIVPVNW